MADRKNENSQATVNRKADVSDEELVDKSSWMVRPCAVYDSEHTECVKPRGRFYQYYIDGKLADCNIWRELKIECRKWMESDDVKAAAIIIKHEKELVESRVQSRLENDVWVRRNENERPPSNWEDPLPPHILEKHVGSFLAAYDQAELLEPIDVKRSSCCIS